MNRVWQVVAWLIVTPVWAADRARTWTEEHLNTWRTAR